MLVNRTIFNASITAKEIRRKTFHFTEEKKVRTSQCIIYMSLNPKES